MNQQTEALQRAYDMGAKGAEPTEEERLLFESWMRGHCWMVHGDWDGSTYVDSSEKSGYLHPGAMLTRQLWAAWRDRAALAAQPAPVQVNACNKPTDAMVEAATNEYDEWSKDNQGTTECIRAMLVKAMKAAPPTTQRQWVGLTDDEWDEFSDKYGMIIFGGLKQEIEAKLKEKNNG